MAQGLKSDKPGFKNQSKHINGFYYYSTFKNPLNIKIKKHENFSNIGKHEVFREKFVQLAYTVKYWLQKRRHRYHVHDRKT